MPPKWNFILCFKFLISLKNNSSKVKNKIQNTLIKWDTQGRKQLVLTRKNLVLEQNVVWNTKL